MLPMYLLYDIIGVKACNRNDHNSYWSKGIQIQNLKQLSVKRLEDIQKTVCQ